MNLGKNHAKPQATVRVHYLKVSRLILLRASRASLKTYTAGNLDICVSNLWSFAILTSIVLLPTVACRDKSRG